MFCWPCTIWSIYLSVYRQLWQTEGGGRDSESWKIVLLTYCVLTASESSRGTHQSLPGYVSLNVLILCARATSIEIFLLSAAKRKRNILAVTSLVICLLTDELTVEICLLTDLKAIAGSLCTFDETSSTVPIAQQRLPK